MQSDKAAIQVLEVSGVAQGEDNRHEEFLCHCTIRLLKMSPQMACWCQAATA